MTHAQLIRAVAGATGESPRTVRRLGFALAPARPGEPEPHDLVLAVDCPFCGRPTSLAAGPGGPPAFAECAGCDVAFDYPAADVYLAPARTATPAAPRRLAV